MGKWYHQDWAWIVVLAFSLSMCSVADGVQKHGFCVSNCITVDKQK